MILVLLCNMSINVPFLDLTGEFRKAENIHDEKINFSLDHHWTPLGHKIAAKAIAKWLNKENFLNLKSNYNLR